MSKTMSVLAGSMRGSPVELAAVAFGCEDGRALPTINFQRLPPKSATAPVEFQSSVSLSSAARSFLSDEFFQYRPIRHVCRSKVNEYQRPATQARNEGPIKNLLVQYFVPPADHICLS